MISRRNFLKLLIGSGALIAYPLDLSQASEAEIDSLWPDLCHDPIVFNVEDRTIYAPWGEYPKTYSDLYEISTDFSGRDDLVATYDQYFDLQGYFYNAFEDAASEENSLAQKLFDRFGMDDGVIAWLNKAQIDDLTNIVDGWLSSDLPIGYEMPLQSGPMGEAYGFFLNQDFSILDALGVVIVEGEHPGSSYYAAELRLDVTEANYAAAALDLPIRFKEVA